MLHRNPRFGVTCASCARWLGVDVAPRIIVQSLHRLSGSSANSFWLVFQNESRDAAIRAVIALEINDYPVWLKVKSISLGFCT